MEFFQGCAGVNGLAGLLRGGAKVFGVAGDHHGGGGVGYYDVVRWAGLALEDAAYYGGVIVGVATLEGFDGGAAQTKIFGGHRETTDFAVADFGDLRFTGEGDFIEAAGSVEDESALDGEIGEGCGDEIDQVGGENAEDLGLRGGGIGERTE